MEVIEKFIVDRNDLRYIYTEKMIGNFNNVSYRMYISSQDFVSLSSNEFYEIYGDDYRASIQEFIKYSMGDVMCSKENFNDAGMLIKDLRLLEKHFKKLGSFNPSLWGCRDTLLTSIDKYNHLIEDRDLVETDEYDYESDLEKLNGDDANTILLRIREEDI